MNLRKIASTTMISTILGTGLAVLPAEAAQAHTAVGHTAVFYAVSGYEDGSGTITRTVTHVGQPDWVNRYRVGAGVLPFDCETQGNRVCGPLAEANGVKGPKTTTVVLSKRPGMPHSVALTLRTDVGRYKVSARIATDTDVEGEVIR